VDEIVLHVILAPSAKYFLNSVSSPTPDLREHSERSTNCSLYLLLCPFCYPLYLLGLVVQCVCGGVESPIRREECYVFGSPELDGKRPKRIRVERPLTRFCGWPEREVSTGIMTLSVSALLAVSIWYIATQEREKRWSLGLAGLWCLLIALRCTLVYFHGSPSPDFEGFEEEGPLLAKVPINRQKQTYNT